MGGEWDAMTPQSTTTPDVAMIATAAPPVAATAAPLVAATAAPLVAATAQPHVAATTTLPATTATDAVIDETTNPTIPFGTYAAGAINRPYVESTSTSSGLILPAVDGSPATQNQRLRALEIASQVDDIRAAAGQSTGSPSTATMSGGQPPREQDVQPAATMSGGEPEADPDSLEPGSDSERPADDSSLPPPRPRAPRPEGTMSDSEPAATMSGGEPRFDLDAELARRMDVDQASDLGMTAEPDDEFSSIGGRSASNLSRVLIDRGQDRVAAFTRLRNRVREASQKTRNGMKRAEWMTIGACINYDKVADSQIHHLVDCGLGGDVIDSMTLNDERKWLWNRSFEKFVRAARVAPLCDHSRSGNYLYAPGPLVSVQVWPSR
jgi:hypothetical protein